MNSRIKVAAQPAVYHCMTRVVGQERLLGDREKEILRKQLWQVADFCGVEVLTYTVMSNHFHVLVRVRPVDTMTDEELVRRVTLLYGEAKSSAVATELKGLERDQVRQRYLERMGDVSILMKELKQRFSIWYNRTHKRIGTL